MRVLLGLACRALGDEDTGRWSWRQLRVSFGSWEPHRSRPGQLADRGAASVGDQGLTPRELEVLCLLAAGRTNKAIATELVLSERTVERHGATSSRNWAYHRALRPRPTPTSSS